MNETLLTLEDVLRQGRDLGLDLSERTFRYYSVVGLLPKPIKKPTGTTDARVHYYPQDIMQRLQDIRSLQAQGYSLKQIKDYFGVTGHVPVSEVSDEPSGGILADAERLLRELTGPNPTEAARQFVASATLDLSEETLRRSVMQYYEELLALFLGPDRAAATLRQMISGMSPLEIESMLRPLRTMRNREFVRRTQRKEWPAARALRDITNHLLSGRDLASSQLETIRQVIGTLSPLQSRLVDRHPLLPPVAARVSRWLAQAVEGLLRAAQVLREAQDRDSITQALVEIDEAEKTVADASRFLDQYRRLLTRELESSSRLAPAKVSRGKRN